MTIILLILKIIGIFLLTILSLILLLLLVVLFVPIRYRVALEHGEIVTLEGKVSWLLHVIHGSVSLKHGKSHIRFRIFGKVIYDNLRPTKKRVRKKRAVKKATKEVHHDVEELENDIFSELISREEQEKVLQKAKNDFTDHVKTLPDNLLEREPDCDEPKSIFEKIKDKIKKIKSAIIHFFKNIKDKIILIYQKICNIKRSMTLISEFYHNETNKEAIKYCFTSLKKLIKHILPTKFKSSLIFGTGDPCSTGQTLGVLGVLYSIYGDNINITPDFEHKRFEGRHFAKGRIRIFTVLIIGIKLILDKRFKQFRRNLKTLKEAL